MQRLQPANVVCNNAVLCYCNWDQTGVAASGVCTSVAQVYIKPCLAVCDLWRKLGPPLISIPAQRAAWNAECLSQRISACPGPSVLTCPLCLACSTCLSDLGTGYFKQQRGGQCQQDHTAGSYVHHTLPYMQQCHAKACRMLLGCTFAVGPAVCALGRDTHAGK